MTTPVAEMSTMRFDPADQQKKIALYPHLFGAPWKHHFVQCDQLSIGLCLS